MTFRILALPKSEFEGLFALSDEALAAQRARRMDPDAVAGMPCRVSLEDAVAGETVLLLNYTHLDTDTPYRASHAICVREHAAEAVPALGDVPFAIRRRLISARLFDAPGNIVGSDVFEGTQLAGFLAEGFQREDVAYAHIHYARNGCFAAKAVRA